MTDPISYRPPAMDMMVRICSGLELCKIIATFISYSLPPRKQHLLVRHNNSFKSLTNY